MTKQKMETEGMLIVRRANTSKEMDDINQIRREVFVIEQHVPEREEYDEFEEESHHFIATLDGEPIGCGRWRGTEKGVKLERIAVKKEHRGHGFGEALVQTMLNNIQEAFKGNIEPYIYLHSQLKAVPLYERTGFIIIGDIFQECEIDHYFMSRCGHSVYRDETHPSPL